ncbi:hypothetical protein ThrDRAFT_02226 [Frankia casuarinae]|uniref:HNH endonuclease signature motif containing protein n=1 Tax=Frankia TaxID=1854 RepID=UPI0003CFDC77|nr:MULTISPECIES: HNH endonuclease signature motif containing protein [Frankia]ETA02485.1 hypothetical protein CcI6DRAFT_02076 [Frankia sp. CcI6]EYT92113.1 hypothetical protein ThrDRAFT_02226 [Frankia casuarinae]OHV48591.1 HNH nuclease [Frankia sp. CgIS1]
MTITAGPALGQHLVPSGLAVVAEQVGGLLDAPVWSLSDAELYGALDDCSVELARLAAVRLALVREAHGRNLAVREGATSTAALLRERLRIRPGDAHRLVDLALALAVDGPLSATGAALAAGAITVEQAVEVRTTIRSLPRGLDAQVYTAAEASLLELARMFDPRELARLGRHLREQLTRIDTSPGGDGPANTGSQNGDREGADSGTSPGPAGGPAGDDNQNPGNDNQDSGNGNQDSGDAPADRRGLWITDLPGGSTRITGELDAEAAALLRSALDPLAKPRPADDGTLDPRTPAQRRADALVDLLHRTLATAALPVTGGVRPHLTVTVSWTALLGQGGTPATTSWGQPLPASVLRRLACDATVTRVVFDAASVPLDVGRAHRTAPADLRRAVIARDVCCSFPGCDRPPSWCEVHHVRHWIDGGRTSLDNLVLLCGYHHRLIHHHGWIVRIGHDRRPEFIPPPWVDSDQIPRRNPYSRHTSDLLRAATVA